MKTVSTPTLNLIRIDKIGPAIWNGDAMSPPDVGTFTKGSTVTVKNPTAGVFVRPSKEKNWSFGDTQDTIPGGLNCRVEEVAADGVWVSASKEQLMASGVWGAIKDYFKMDAGAGDRLWFKLPASSF